jgi:tRNA-dependent cyclodipeptide synthase
MLAPNLYRVRVNSCPQWTQYAHCTLGVSVGQPYHDGEKFAATVEWAARHFEHIRVDVSDTLQRHRLVGEGASYPEAEARSLGAGDQWIAGARPVLIECERSFSVVRWNAWLQRPDFLAVLDQYARLASSDPVLSRAIAADVEGFIERREKKGLLNAGVARATSRAYLLEELSVITLQGAAERSARIYPGPQLECFKVVRDGQVPDAPAGLGRDYYVHINLERKSIGPRPRATVAALG